MILDLVVKKTDDGYTAEIPKLKGCETWAHDEESVINNILELASFYLKIPEDKIKFDKARGNFTKSIYKLIINNY